MLNAAVNRSIFETTRYRVTGFLWNVFYDVCLIYYTHVLSSSNYDIPPMNCQIIKITIKVHINSLYLSRFDESVNSVKHIILLYKYTRIVRRARLRLNHLQLKIMSLFYIKITHRIVCI